MEGGSGYNSIPPSTSFDKSRVLDVKPLRSLKPVFPSTSEAPPFVCAPPNGPFPPGFTPFYPFSAPQVSQTSPNLNHGNPPPVPMPMGPIPAPLRAFRSSQSPGIPGIFNGNTTQPTETFREVDENADGLRMNEDGYVDGQKRAAPHLRGSSSSQKKTRKNKVTKSSLSGIAAKRPRDFVEDISPVERSNGNRELVYEVLLRFDALRRRLSQMEEAKEQSVGIIKRADLKAGNILMSRGVRTNMTRRIGAVPGVEIGDIFFFRIELCVVGLHAQSMGGIDYMIIKDNLDEEPLAMSIVSSGGYDDDAEDGDVLIYSGQGGNFGKKDKQASDQKLERGNLALERSVRRANDIRVIRGIKDAVNPSSKVYIYDGLYRIQESWSENKSGCNIFKYKFVRMPGQPGAFAVWKSIQKWKEGLSSRVGLILPDLTSGAESLPVSLVNDVDEEKGPAHFSYFPTLRYLKSFNLTQHSIGCDCHNACQPGDLNCGCIRKNGGDFPYTNNGILVGRKPLIHECSPACSCFPNCKNRVSQHGLKVHLEVFRTTDRGWGLRSWDPIRAGTFICEYAGEVVDEVKGRRGGEEGENDEYLFDTNRVYNTFKWNCEPELLEEESSGDANEDYKIPFPLVISAKTIGNVARFMNHSCSPNVFWQPVLYEQSNQSFLHIAFFAMGHIPPMKELTYDYGISRSDEVDGDIELNRKKKCLCGSSNCRGYFG
ncbi:Histone-lysine N-methyltransferase, H3 lysine-9 specific SUVH3 [Morella rubra]|uniref:Histone-lysine N-methyltransferase, H3 lysine-9 specific SUVH3 n=1 Tax=Morella rubra TaxID=262757 RepID=A0A6A1WMQ7_9ROSI|nr:Histone-lysine N-methyltransferase, H3 lysine-9 specific SUVH3 [Morella rubra]